MNPDIKKCHDTYCALAFPLDLTMQRIYVWEAFLARFKEEDLSYLLRKLNRDIKSGKKGSYSISFRILLGNLDLFEELLAEYRALERKPRYAAGKVDVLKATGRESEPKQADAKPAGTVIEGLKIAQQLRDFREKL